MKVFRLVFLLAVCTDAFRQAARGNSSAVRDNSTVVEAAHCDTIYLRSMYGYGNSSAVRLCGHRCGGYGMVTRDYKDYAAEFKICSWSGRTGPINSGDSVYLQAMSHGFHFVEVCGVHCSGYGVATRATKMANAEFNIYSWSGRSGPIRSAEDVYLQAKYASHYVRVCGAECGGYGLATQATLQRSTEFQFMIYKWSGSRGQIGVPSHESMFGNGAWVPLHSINAGMEITSNIGTVKSSEETKTSSWSRSTTNTLSITMSAGVGFMGMSAGVEVGSQMSSTYSQEFSSTQSEYWSMNQEEGYKLNFPPNSGFLWQWQVRIELNSGEVITSKTRNFAVTSGRWQKPRCFPGYEMDGASCQQCYSQATTIVGV